VAVNGERRLSEGTTTTSETNRKGVHASSRSSVRVVRVVVCQCCRRRARRRPVRPSAPVLGVGVGKCLPTAARAERGGRGVTGGGVVVVAG